MCANVAQSVERFTRNEQVIGSIPIIGSIFFNMFHGFGSAGGFPVRLGVVQV